MRLRLALITILTVVSFVPWPGEGQGVSAAPLRLAAEDDADPWSRADGTGFANDVVRAAFKAVGREVSIVVVPYARCRRLAIDGAVAGCFSMSPAPDVAGRIELPGAPHLQSEAVLVQAHDRPLAARTLQQLGRGPVLGAVLGYEYPVEFEALRRRGAITIAESPSEVVLLRKLAAGRLAGAVVTINASKPLALIAARAGVTERLDVVASLGALPAYVGFSLRHAHGREARVLFERGLAAVRANGTYARLEQRWMDSSAAVTRRVGARVR